MNRSIRDIHSVVVCGRDNCAGFGLCYTATLRHDSGSMSPGINMLSQLPS